MCYTTSSLSSLLSYVRVWKLRLMRIIQKSKRTNLRTTPMCRWSQPQRPPYFPNCNDVAFVPCGHCLRYHDQLQRKQIGNSSREFLCCSYPVAPNSLWNCTVMWQGEERSVPLAVVRKGISYSASWSSFLFDSVWFRILYSITSTCVYFMGHVL